MPQLSPLNWIFLFILFWFILFMVTSIIWWYKKPNFNVSISGSTSKKINYWSW